MKNTVIVLFVLSIFLNVSGQETKKINYQLNFGASISFPFKKSSENIPDIEYKFATNYTSDLNYFIEMMISYNFNHRLSLNSGASFTNNQLQVHTSAGWIEQDGIIRNSYLGIPIIFDYQVLKKAPLRAGVGVYINFLLYAKEKGTNYYDTTELYTYYPDPLLESFEPVQKYEINSSDHFNTMDFGLTAKVEYEFKFTEKFAMLVFSKFNFGLTKIVKRSNSLDEWKNKYLLIGLGFKV